MPLTRATLSAAISGNGSDLAITSEQEGRRIKHAERKIWQDARTLRDLGELTAQWLEGSLASQPPYAPDCGPSEETRDLIPTLAAVNRAGFVTDCSQPATEATSYNRALYWQRAGVTGFADDAVLERIRKAVCRTELTVLVHHADRPLPTDRLAVTINAGKECTWFGGQVDRAEIAYLYKVCHPIAINALCQAWQVTIIDQTWGRNNVLWPQLSLIAED